MIASAVRAMAIPIVPQRRGLRRPIRSMKNMMKMRSGFGLLVYAWRKAEEGERTCEGADTVVNACDEEFPVCGSISTCSRQRIWELQL